MGCEAWNYDRQTDGPTNWQTDMRTQRKVSLPLRRRRRIYKYQNYDLILILNSWKSQNNENSDDSNDNKDNSPWIPIDSWDLSSPLLLATHRTLSTTTSFLFILKLRNKCSVVDGILPMTWHTEVKIGELGSELATELVSEWVWWGT